jgi:hypothetical protein
MTYSTPSGSYTVDDVRANADSLNGSATGVFVRPDIPTSFWWKLEDPIEGAHIYALPDVTIADLGAGDYTLYDVANPATIVVYQVYQTDTDTGPTYGFAAITLSSTGKPDQILAGKYPKSTVPSMYVDAVIGAGHSSAEDAGKVHWLDEFYVSVSGNAGYFDQSFAPFGMNAPDDGRFLIARDQATGMRDTAWGSKWLDTQHAATFNYPKGIDQAAAALATGAVQATMSGMATLYERLDLELSKPMQKWHKSSDTMAGVAVGTYLSMVDNLYGSVDETLQKPESVVKVFEGATALKSAAKIAGGLGTFLTIYDAVARAQHKYLETDSFSQALLYGVADVGVSLISGQAGLIIAEGVAYGVAGLVIGAGATGALPVLAGATIALASGAITTWAVSTTLNYYQEHPLPLPWLDDEDDMAPKLLASAAAAAPPVAPMQSPAWIYNADTGKMILSLKQTNPDLWKETATRAFLTDPLKIKPAKLKLTGTDDDDQMSGGNNNDKLSGLWGDDSIAGAKGNDKLDGGSGADLVVGNAGNDTLLGSWGGDTLVGGRGRDAFTFKVALASSNVIEDFKRGTDQIRLGTEIFSAIGERLDKGEFYKKAGAVEAHDSDDFIIYDRATGTLYYDPDADGAGEAKRFAILDNKPGLSIADFAIV